MSFPVADRPSREESARLLRQRIEMGGSEIFLDGMSRDEALAMLERAAALAPSLGAGSSSVPVPAPRRSTAEAVTPSSPPQRRTAVAADGGAPSPVVLPDSYDELKSLALECTQCGLCQSRTQVVFSDGPSDARVMVVGEAPGANEDETGVPFVGAAGKYLDLLLATVGLSRKESVYIANVLKCRPPGNRNPSPEEIEACAPYLRKQIDLVQPKVLLAVGSFSGKLLTGDQKSPLGKLRGQIHHYHGVPLVVTYHPAALLRNSNWTRAFWSDLQLLREVIESADSA